MGAIANPRNGIDSSGMAPSQPSFRKAAASSFGVRSGYPKKADKKKAAKKKRRTFTPEDAALRIKVTHKSQSAQDSAGQYGVVGRTAEASARQNAVGEGRFTGRDVLYAVYPGAKDLLAPTRKGKTKGPAESPAVLGKKRPRQLSLLRTRGKFPNHTLIFTSKHQPLVFSISHLLSKFLSVLQINNALSNAHNVCELNSFIYLV
mgnify:CR=1 FL=1